MRFAMLAALCALVACGAPAAPHPQPVVLAAPPASVAPPPPIPPLARALLEWRPGQDEEELWSALDAVEVAAKSGARIDRQTTDALWACFLRYQPSKSNSIRGTQVIHDAVIAVEDPSYAEKAVTAIGAPAGEAISINDQTAFWQTTAIQVLRDLRYAPAAKPLVTVLMTKDKVGLASLARAALARIPDAAVPALRAALDGSDPELVKLGADWGKDKLWVALVLDALGETTLDAARDAIVASVPTLDTDGNRMAAAHSLVFFPSTPPSVAAIKTIYAHIAPLSTTERSVVLRLASDLYDPAFASWALQEAIRAGDELAIVALDGEMKLMSAADRPSVMRALAKLDASSAIPPAEKKLLSDALHAKLRHASEALDACGRNASCYTKLLDQPIAPTQGASFKAVKAVTMAALLGDEHTRKELVARVPLVPMADVRIALAFAINHLAPKGDAEDADALERVVAADRDRHDPALLEADDVLVRVAWMLRARRGDVHLIQRK